MSVAAVGSERSNDRGTLHWFSCTEVVGDTVTEFVYVSSLDVDYQQVIALTETGGACVGRLRTKGSISRNITTMDSGISSPDGSMRAMENYYHLMQIAYLINQLVELSTFCTSIRRKRESMAHLWDTLVGELRSVLDVTAGLALFAGRMQFRYT